MLIFKKVVDIVIKLLIPFVSLALMLGIARLFLDLRLVFSCDTIAAGFDIIITDTLSMFVVVELLRSIMDYFEVHRLRLTYIVDAALVFIIREVMIGLYDHKIEWTQTLALSVLMLVLSGIRSMAIIYSPDRNDRPERSAV
jgi:uncharacterized membrane protein (DUF373 family)